MLKMNDVTLRICNKYMFTGYFDGDNNLCSPLSPVTHLNFMMERKYLGFEEIPVYKDNNYVLCKTNGNGVIQDVVTLSDNKKKYENGKNVVGVAIKTPLVGKAPKLIIPPADLMLKVMAGYEEEKEWADKLCEIVEQSGMKLKFSTDFKKNDKTKEDKVFVHSRRTSCSPPR